MAMFTKKGDEAVLAKLREAPAQYREIGERLHAITSLDAATEARIRALVEKAAA
jgi:hypothetical protein